MSEFLLAGFIMAVGVALAGAGTHLYQFVSGQPAALRYDGRTMFHMFGHLTVSFLCGPYIMLQLGWTQGTGDTLSVSMALVAAFVAFGWAFVTVLLAVGSYIAVIG
jgi:hypothetical protein